MHTPTDLSWSINSDRSAYQAARHLITGRGHSTTRSFLCSIMQNPVSTVYVCTLCSSGAPEHWMQIKHLVFVDWGFSLCSRTIEVNQLKGNWFHCQCTFTWSQLERLHLIETSAKVVSPKLVGLKKPPSFTQYFLSHRMSTESTYLNRNIFMAIHSRSGLEADQSHV